jgi:hypothetical protein
MPCLGFVDVRIQDEYIVMWRSCKNLTFSGKVALFDPNEISATKWKFIDFFGSFEILDRDRSSILREIDNVNYHRRVAGYQQEMGSAEENMIMMMKRTKGKSADEKKEKLLSDLIDVRKRIIQEATLLSPEMEDKVFIGTWAIGDLLAHLSGWDITNLEAAKEILEGKVPSFYAYEDRDWASYNVSLINEYKEDHLRNQLSLVESTHNELINFLETIPAPEFFKERGLRVNRYEVILSDLLEVEKKDEEVHLQQIKDFVESFQSTE